VTEGPSAATEGQGAARRRRAIVGVGVISLIAVLQVAAQSFGRHERIVSTVLLSMFAMPLLMFAYAAAFRVAAARRLGPVPTLAMVALLGAVLGALVGAGLWTLGGYYPGLRPRTGEPLLVRSILFGVVFGQVSLGLWALAFVFPFAVEDAQIRRLEAETLRLEAEKLRTAAELARLRAHLEPHFLLNTLNAIAGLVTDDPREARRLLVCLGDLLRDALREEDEMQTLDEQIAWLRRYAEILQARHAGSLLFRWDIAEDARGVMLPRLLLQPLVENAVQHGALRRETGGEVTVRAEVSAGGAGQQVVFTIEDNGPGPDEGPTRSGAFGLHAVRRRLELRYPEHASLRLEHGDFGTRSIVLLPMSPTEHSA
jgi:signal transduction histidine kinase